MHRLILAQLKQQLTKSAEQTTVAPLAGGDDQQVAETGQNFAAGFKPVTARRTDTSASTDQSASIPPAREMVHPPLCPYLFLLLISDICLLINTVCGGRRIIRMDRWK